MVMGQKEHAFARASVPMKTRLRHHQMAQIHKAQRPHLELLPQLQVHVVHLRDGNVVVLPLLLAEQLVPGRSDPRGEGVFMCLVLLCEGHLRQTFRKK